MIYVIVVREALDYLSMIIGKLIVGVFWSFQWSLAQASRSGLQAGLAVWGAKRLSERLIYQKALNSYGYGGE